MSIATITRAALVDLELLHHLLDDTALSLADIARQCGCSREYVRQIYTRDFAGDGRERLRRIRESSFAGDPTGLSPALRRLWDLAEQQGCMVSRVVERDRGVLRRWGGCLLINGRFCTASLCRKAHKNGYLSSYTQHRWSPEHEFVVAMQRVPRFKSHNFVIPTTDLLRFRSTSFFLPLTSRQQVYKNRTRRLDWDQYLDAWHLLTWPTTRDE